MQSSSQKATTRLAFLDWTRGLAALIMLQGHVFHSLNDKNLRNDSPYVLSQFLGGITPAIFLFLTGVTLAFLLDSRERQGLRLRGRILAGLGRARYLIVVAMLFRLQLWLFAWGQNSWRDLFKVDILNCMALAIAVLSLLAAFPIADRIRYAAILGAAIAAASPIVSALPWDRTPFFIAGYFAPDYNQFSFFPWAAFLAFGLSAGSLFRVVPAQQIHRLMQWSALTGFGLVIAAHYFSNLPYSLYSSSEFWLNSPALIFIKLGVVLLIMSFAFLWNQPLTNLGWSWVRQLGTTSLLVYWVHIELVYGRWMGAWKENLTNGQTALVAFAVILLMIGLSVARTRWRDWIPANRFWPMAERLPQRVPGD